MSTPPEPTAPPPEPPAPTGGPDADPAAGLRAALDQERKARKDLETELAKAREDGKTQAAHATALVAAAEFRVQAAGKIADPEAVLAVIDMAKLLDDKQQPDKAAIAQLVAQLAAVPPPGGHVPGGPQGPASGSGDWLREQMRGTR